MSSEKNKNQEAVGSGGSRKDATDQARAMDNGYVIELRRRRLQISQQIIDLVHELLGTKELKSRFSKFEREVILSQKTPDGKVSKFLDLLERKGRDTYEMFVVALGYVKPELHLLLRQRQANGEASPSPGSPASSLRQDSEEAAGIYGLSACNNSVSIHRLGHLSYSAREFLASTLNQKQTEFCQLCQAMEVESSLMQASLRSRNPTAYLIQELPDTTIDRLEKALSKIGRSDLFTALSRHFDDSDDDDCV